MSIRGFAAGSALAALFSFFALPAAAHPITFQGTLSNAGEPPPADQSLGTGFVSIILDEDAFTLGVHVTFSDLTGNTTASHIHCCTASAGSGNAGVATPLPSFPNFPLGVTAGSYDQDFDMTQASSWNPAFITANGGSIAAAFAAFATGLHDGKAYLNIHTTFSGAGEIRTFPSEVPEPGTFALLGIGVATLSRVARRRPAA